MVKRLVFEKFNDENTPNYMQKLLHTGEAV